MASGPASMVESRPSEIWDAITIDLFIKVAELSILSPLFAMWVPVLLYAQGYHSGSQPYQLSVAYFLVTVVLAFVPWSSRIWTNRAWRSDRWVYSFFGGPSLSWDDQIVVVTGGAGGVGQTLIGTLAVMGATVICLDKEEVAFQWDDVYSYKCDLASEEQIEVAVKRIQEEVGHPTILINNAGVVHGKLILDLTRKEMESSLAVNVMAQFSLVRLLLPAMIKAKAGHIVTVSSVFGFGTTSQLGDYAASKHALVALHETLRTELRHRYGDPPIRTTLLCPGHIQTPLFGTIARPSPLTAFLAPTVEPHNVAKAIVAALEKEQSGELFLPKYGAVLWALRGMPSWARDFLEWLSDSNRAMLPWKPARPEKAREQ